MKTSDVLAIVGLVERFALYLKELTGLARDGVSDEELDQLDADFDVSVAEARRKIREARG